MQKDSTTVRVGQENWKRLNSQKEQPGESFNDVITRLLEDND